MTALPWAVAGAFLAVALIAFVRATRPYAPTVDPGRAWARCICGLVERDGRYIVNFVPILVKSDPDGGWRVTLPSGVGVYDTLDGVEDALAAWWWSPEGRRTLMGAKP